MRRVSRSTFISLRWILRGNTSPVFEEEAEDRRSKAEQQKIAAENRAAEKAHEDARRASEQQHIAFARSWQAVAPIRAVVRRHLVQKLAASKYLGPSSRGCTTSPVMPTFLRIRNDSSCLERAVSPILLECLS
jgi:hypothetical protein